VVLITGANNPYGIGAATARAFAAQGAAVCIAYKPLPPQAGAPAEMGEDFYRFQTAKDAAEVLESIHRAGGRADAWEADLAEPANIPTVFDRAEATFGRVEVLVNNAAVSDPDTFVPGVGGLHRAVDGFPMQTITAATHDRIFAVNARATALLMAEFARRHVARGATWGRIISISTDGASAFPTQISYGASKHALESYSRAAAGELGRFGVTVNIISPGPVQTGWIGPRLAEEIPAEIPLGRIGRPEEIADAILFFASEQASWITGQLLYVGGGHVMPL
jgi:3-oxoacyl-[acyl-carrier protein] reductase